MCPRRIEEDHKDFIVTEELIKTQADISISSPYYKVVDKFIKEAEDLKIETIAKLTGLTTTEIQNLV